MFRLWYLTFRRIFITEELQKRSEMKKLNEWQKTFLTISIISLLGFIESLYFTDTLNLSLSALLFYSIVKFFGTQDGE